jgi:hypothetical protein
MSSSSYKVPEYSQHRWPYAFHDELMRFYAGARESQHPEWKSLDDADDWAFKHQDDYDCWYMAFVNGETINNHRSELIWDGEREKLAKKYQEQAEMAAAIAKNFIEGRSK